MITLARYFDLHGKATRLPRTVLPYHRLVLDALGLVIRGRLPDGKRNLMINLPPGHSKTFIAHDFVSYGLGCYPDSQFLYCSYSGTLATKETSAILRTVTEDWYKSIFPGVTLKKSSSDYFTTTAGGQVYGVGLEGTITGFRAGQKRPGFSGTIVIDDAMKADDARSMANLTHVQRWYTGTVSSRKNRSETPVVLIGQRLHPDDICGHILKTEPELWHHITIPGLLDDGTALWPETKSAADLIRLREVDEFTFWSQYQQQPIAPGGNMIKRDWWRFYERKGYDVDSLVFITADTALKAKTVNDNSSFGCWHATPQSLDLLDKISGKWEFPEMMRRAKAFFEKWKPYGCMCIYIEDKASGPSLAQSLAEQAIPCKLWKPADYGFPDDKVGRVQHSLWFIEAGRVRLPEGKPEMTGPFIDECAAFTGDDTVHDDDVDMMTTAVSIYRWKGGANDIRAM
jgi:predicted phage terminase large subunit-like protein